MKRRTNRYVLITAVFLISIIFATVCTSSPITNSTSSIKIVAVDEIGKNVQSKQLAEGEAFDTVISVLTSPRCINCHPTGDRPRQRDDQIFHLFNVTRGEDNHGGPIQTCDTCHHEENNEYSNVPGAPHWGLAPKSMGWYGLTDIEIAEVLLDPEMNGGRSHEDLLHHMSEDALVLWAWDPGNGRTPPPVSHDEFVDALEIWFEAGAPIPSK